MKQGRIITLLLAFLFSFSNVVIAAEPHGDDHDTDHASHDEIELSDEEESEVRKALIKGFIGHHLQDSHDFTLFHTTDESGEEHHVGFSLPVILWDDGLKVFSSSKFEHGHKVAEVDGNYYILHHGKIYKTDAEGTLTYDKEDHHKVTNDAPIDLSITKNVVFIFFMFLLMFFLFRGMAKSYAKNGPMPKGAGRFLEPIILFVRDDIAIPNIGEKKYRKFMPYLLTVFFFIWIINLLGLSPLGVNVTNSLAVSGALAILTFLITTFSANAGYWKHIFWMPGVPVPMKIILAPIELLGIFIKPFSLMIRLFANITAGHVVIMSLIAMVVYSNFLGSTLSFMLTFLLGILELLVAALQAYIFTMLSALYFGSAVEEHDHAEAH